MGMPASPRYMAGPHCRCFMEMLMLTLTSSSPSVEWAPMVQQMPLWEVWRTEQGQRTTYFQSLAFGTGKLALPAEEVL